MQIDPAFEFRRLAEEYRAKTAAELVELAADFADLTEPAQQALRQEMQSRKLCDPGAAPPVANAPIEQAESAPQRGVRGVLDSAASSAIATDDQTGNVDEMGSYDYTWKTVLCDCDSPEQALQLLEVLRRAGIEGWTQYQGSRIPGVFDQIGVGQLQILVAADQLDQARAVAARPIPQEIVDDSKEDVPDFTPPVCPKCGASDPVLEAVDPQNTWRCEQCGEQWSDPAEVIDGKAEKAGEQPA
jgi:hypothetical protein